MNFLDAAKSLTISVVCLCLPLPSVGSDDADSVRQMIPLAVGEASEYSIHGIRVVSPVTERNFDMVMEEIRQRGSLRELTAAESNTLMSSIAPGTYFFAYGFQLETTGDPVNALVNRLRSTERHQFELHKQLSQETVVLGLTTSQYAESLDWYSATYQPSPQLVPLPLDDFNVLLIIPLTLLDTIVDVDIEFDAGEVAVLRASLRPKKKADD